MNGPNAPTAEKPLGVALKLKKNSDTGTVVPYRSHGAAHVERVKEARVIASILNALDMGSLTVAQCTTVRVSMINCAPCRGVVGDF